MESIVYIPAGVINEAEKFILDNQLLRKELWTRFIGVFRTGQDSDNGGWRGEYFGKMMRGACFTYVYTKNEDLYKVITGAISEILETVHADGAITSYRPGEEYFGWDMWCRKYVLLGMYYYMMICRDRQFKARILKSALGQLNVIIDHIGPEEEGKKPITRTSHFWRGLNSSSILEPVMLYYNLTKEPRLLDFAKYIVDNGGIEGGNIFRLAAENKIDPYMYPVTKAYEMISCMEGLLEYALTTGDEEKKQAVVNFGRRVLDSDFTVIGSGGTTHELFDHSSWRQSSMGVCEIAQETCVTVTMMKFFSRLYRETGDNAFADALETSFFNAYLGAINTGKHVEPKLYEQNNGLSPEFLPFDSYSPLTAGRRGRKIGGFMILPEGHYYGCCACIGSLGAAVMGLSSVRVEKNRILIDQYVSGKVSSTLSDGTEIGLTIETTYPYDQAVNVIIDSISGGTGSGFGSGTRIEISFRIPGWTDKYEISSLPADTFLSETDGYVSIGGQYSAGDRLTIRFAPSIKVIRPVVFGKEQVGDNLIVQDPDAQARVCVKYGPVVLAPYLELDGEGRDVPLKAGLFADNALKNAEITAEKPWADREISGSDNAHLKVALKAEDGETVNLRDYASCGKDWNGPLFGAWFRIRT